MPNAVWVSLSTPIIFMALAKAVSGSTLSVPVGKRYGDPFGVLKLLCLGLKNSTRTE